MVGRARRWREEADESMIGLVRARKYLQRRFGSVSRELRRADLAGRDALNRSTKARALRDRAESPEAVARQARLHRADWAIRIVERINWAVVPNATSDRRLCAARGARIAGCSGRLVRRMQEIVDLLRLQDVQLTPCPRGGPRASSSKSIASLLRSRPDPFGATTRAARSCTSRSRAVAPSTSTATPSSTTWRPRAFSRGACSSGSTLDEELRRDVADLARPASTRSSSRPTGGGSRRCTSTAFGDHFERSRARVENARRLELRRAT